MNRPKNINPAFTVSKPNTTNAGNTISTTHNTKANSIINSIFFTSFPYKERYFVRKLRAQDFLSSYKQLLNRRRYF